jgi:hypothetical protein
MPKGKPVSACARAAIDVDASRINARLAGRKAKLTERIKPPRNITQAWFRAPFYSTRATLNRFAKAKKCRKKIPASLAACGDFLSRASRYGAFSTISVNG